jgi:hypothetical protein
VREGVEGVLEAGDSSESAVESCNEVREQFQDESGGGRRERSFLSSHSLCSCLTGLASDVEDTAVHTMDLDLPLTSLSLPRSLPFPLTIQRVLAPRNSTVHKTQVLLTYSYLPSKPDHNGNRDRQVRSWESPVAGDVVSWAVREGDIVRDHTYVLFSRSYTSVFLPPEDTPASGPF